MIELRVDVKDYPYSIFLGRRIFSQLAKELKKLEPTSVLIVTNTTIAPIYGEKILRVCSAVCRSEIIALPDGEQFKTWSVTSLVLDKLAEMKADRRTVVVALGGGVVGDTAGFAASIYMRGIRFIQVPTTLLAQVDSSVGGKTGVNMKAGKNMIGTFHQPAAVISDTEVLKTLPKREVSAGIAEIIKHGLLADKVYFEEVEKKIDKLYELDPSTTASIVAGSCRIKAKVVAADAKEEGERAKLNLGHTFGHAIEKMMGFGNWLHGEAIGCGCVLAAQMSKELGTLEDEDCNRVMKLIETAKLPTKVPGLPVEAFIHAMKSDKKTAGGVIRFILMDGIGNSYIKEVDENLLRKVLINGGCTQ
ncbi:MAG: 3-dehydroquinate synthase [Burkholderiales bacterium]|nr:3-dehydroquinate synthase [Burkholderiales bacterium]